MRRASGMLAKAASARVLAGAIAGVALGASGALAAPHAGGAITAAAGAPAKVVWHGGGCRKDSPPGKCCHAGSKPYHCH